MSPKTCHCGRSFSKREHFERHRRTHTKEKPFACDECGKAFGRHDSLLRHARSHARETGGRSSISGSTASKTPVAVDHETSRYSTSETFDRDASDPMAGMAHLQPTGSHTSSSVYTDQISNQWNEGIHQHNLSDEITGNQYGDWSLPQHYVIDESWLLGANFDVSALDDSVTAAIASWGQPVPASNYLFPNQSPSDVILQRLQPEVESPVPPKATSAVQIRWYTNITPNASARPSAAIREEQDRVDERYRSSLSTHLRTQLTDDALPSADFLNRCIGLYFSKFHPIFPIIHAPSFRPSTEKALLLLSVCSMGAVLMGTTYAAAQGRKIFQKLNKAVLSTWEKHISRGQEEVLALAQSSVIGQTVAMMSGHSTDLYLAESFHGTVIAWGRRAGMFKLATSGITRGRADSTSSLDALWKDWAHTESKSRVGLALYLHDSLFSSIFHHEPLLRHDASKIPHCGSEEAFNAATAAEWFQLATNPMPSKFHAYVNLAGIIALIVEARRGTMDPGARSRLEQLLLTWRSSQQPASEDTYCSMIMWHQACMSLRTDFDMIEIFIGRDGFVAAEEVLEAVKSWYLTEGATCVAHALQVRMHVERLPAGKEPAIHVPRALFHAGIAMYAFVRMRQMTKGGELSGRASTNTPSSFIASNASDHSSQGIANVDIGDVHNIADLLRRVGHWELSRKLASILDPLLEEVPHE